MPPNVLLESLEAVRRRVKTLSVVYGLGLLVAVAMLALLATVGLDYLLQLPAFPRLLLVLICVAAIAHIVWHNIVRPALARVTLGDVAGRIERVYPQFDDRLRSTVNFLTGGANPGSDFMQQRVVGEAGTIAQRVDLSAAVLTRPAWVSSAAGLGAIALVLLVATTLMTPQARSIAFTRLINPFTDVRWPPAVQIDLVGTTPKSVPVGQRVDVRMHLTRGDRGSRKAVVFYRYGDGPVQQELMTRGADGSYAASLDARVDAGNADAQASGQMQVWIISGDGRLDVDPIRVVQRLAIKDVQATITPPAYVKQAIASTVNLGAAPAQTAIGSDIVIRVQFNKALATGELIQLVPATGDGKASKAALPNVKWTRSADNVAEGRFTATESFRFGLRATDVDGFKNNGLEEYEVIVRPDQNPSVQIETPRRSEERTAVATVPMTALAEDDYGVQTLTLMVERLGDKTKWEIPLVADQQAAKDVGWARVEGSGDRQRFRAEYLWDLHKLDNANLKGGDVLEYYLAVTDNFALDGQHHDPVASGKLRITIISQEELSARVIDELRQAKQQIIDTSGVQARTREETRDLAEQTQKKDDFDPADKAAIDRLTNQQSTTASQARQIAAKVEAVEQKLLENQSPAQDLKDLARDVKNDLNRAAEGSMKEATQDLTKAQQQSKPPEARNAAMNDAQKAQQQANDDLQRATDRMANIGSLQQSIDRLNQILDDQKQTSKATAEAGKDNLGKKPEEMKPADRQKLDKAAADQAKLADRTAKAIEEMEKLAGEMQKSDPAAAEAMKKAAATAKQQQVPQKQQSASKAAKENQQASAQSAQKQAELGLEMVLKDLREAEKRKLAELSKQLAEMQKQIDNLIRRQSSHNLDDLTLQGPERLTAVGAETVKALTTKSGRDGANAPAAATLPGLTGSQEQTERNTRDLVKAAEAMPKGAETGAALLRASGRMERAVFALRDKKLPEAYDPAQVEALAALEATAKLIDQQKQQADEKIASSQKETVRQLYVKLKEDQEKLAAETVRLEGARDAAGKLARADGVRLAQLPGEQGKLAARISEMDAQLADVGAIVYVWANKDIASTMTKAKDSLGQSITGEATQSKHRRIVSLLDAMIRNLKETPRESKFAQESQDQPGGGGGGGAGGAQPTPLPQEAELRLLKDLQAMINGGTTDADNAKKPGDDPKTPAVADLGKREGELRDLLDQLMQKASQGKARLGPEPDDRDSLPEEVGADKVADQELDNDLLNGEPDKGEKEGEYGMIGDRMARSRQRLVARGDTGKTTQIIQDRILQDFDKLIDAARKQQAQTRNGQSKPGEAQQQGKPGDEQAQGANQGSKPGQPQQKPGGTQAANDSKPAGGGVAPADLSNEIKESLAEWGGITPRLRDAQIEGASETVIQEYRKLIEDYYRSLAEKANER